MNVSIVIPVKNEEKIIDACLGALHRQTAPIKEIVIVDNGSGDDTVRIVEDWRDRFGERKTNVKILSCPHGNQIEARIMGFDAACGEILGSLDADSQPEPMWLAAGLAYFRAEKNIVAVGGKNIYDHRAINIMMALVSTYFRVRPQEYYFFGSNALFRRNVYLESKGISDCRALMKKLDLQEPHDDLILSMRLQQQGKVRYCASMRAACRARGYRGSTQSLWQRLRRQQQESRQLREILRERS